ncbi:hypothetical protein MMC25_001574 [Agyrium rufum]|nr:hypothetical protein [Agyrium rufum]
MFDDLELNRSAFTRVLALAAVSFVAYSFIAAAYRLSYHPLAKYPGPKLAAATDWYSSAFYKIFGLAFPQENTLSMIDERHHAFNRRILLQALNSTAIKSMENHIIKNADILCDQLIKGTADSDWSQAQNMTKWANLATLDVMSNVVFSQNWGILTSDKNRHLTEAFKNGAGALSIASYQPWVLNLKLDWTVFRKYINGVYEFKKVSDAKTDARIEEGKQGIAHTDVFETLSKVKDPETGEGFNSAELVSECGLLLFAGSDTSSTIVAALFFYLLEYPETLSRITEEIRQTFHSLDDIRGGPELNSCIYLRSCITETLRLNPSAGGIMPREVLPGGVTVDGHVFPQGTDIGVPIYALHHQESHFENPFVFRPTRWIADEGKGVTEEDVARANAAFNAFSYGPRACAGKTMAYFEISVILARILYIFDMRLKPGKRVGGGRDGLGNGRQRKAEFQTYARIISLHDGPFVQFRRRSS